MADLYQIKIDEALNDPHLQAAVYTATARMADRRKATVCDYPGFEDLRQHAHNIKRHALDHLDCYLEMLERNVTAHGGQVVWARDSEEACKFVLDLARERGIDTVVKSKSMTTEEIHLNERLEEAGIDAVETDLGEYILQLNHERPFHILAPALHKTIGDVSKIFERKLHSKPETEPERLTAIARRALRRKFLEAGMGITGANFLLADSGGVVIVENEGNARLGTSAPRIHVAISGIEKVIPRTQDLAVFLKLLGRSATGQQLSVYTSLLCGPRRMGEPDGPAEFYLVLLDNGRTRLLKDPEKRESLFCIRCGACLNHCPVYRKIGGYSYPWVYSGPIGAILTPQYKGLGEDSWLPFASSLCGACGEVCPVKIDIPKILLLLREEIVESRTRAHENRTEKLAFRFWAFVMRHPRLYERLATIASGVAPDSDDGWIQSLPAWMQAGPVRAWLSQRDLPAPPAKSFRQLWRERPHDPKEGI